MRADGQGRDLSQGWAVGQDNVQLWVQLYQGHRAAAEDTKALGWLEGWGDTTPSVCQKEKQDFSSWGHLPVEEQGKAERLVSGD